MLESEPCFSRDRQRDRREALGPQRRHSVSPAPPRWGERLDPPALLGFLGAGLQGSQAGLVNSHWKNGVLMSPTRSDSTAVRHEGGWEPCLQRTLPVTAAAPRAGACSGSRDHSNVPTPFDEQNRSEAATKLTSRPPAASSRRAGGTGERRQGTCTVSKAGGHSGSVGSDSEPVSRHQTCPFPLVSRACLRRPPATCEPPDVRPIGRFSA